MSELARQFLDALRAPADESAVSPFFTYSGACRHFPLRNPLLDAKDAAGLARLHEAVATADLMLLHLGAANHLMSNIEVIGALIQAAHWYRKAGEAELALLPAKRAVYEARRVLDRSDLFKEYDAIYWWYLTEMMGDAAAIYDRALALACYQAALDGFGAAGEDEELGCAQDVGFPYSYLYHMSLHFLTAAHNSPWELARTRIPPKIQEWLRDA
ncbi:MAG: hypothetical protein K0R39_4290 [Symbiobacteriaceae bacterium]|jgi:hypothetical protein|nr:hypothetical protein [Symbiobacteriaceae bacterium]